ncbi:MAG: GNAT family N-acetyltransferase [Faecousia sp.]
MTEKNWSLRPYRPEDCPELARLFYDTVHTVNAADYSPEQLSAWATGEVDPAGWNASFLAHHTVVAEGDGVILGFGDMAADGYLDRLYVHKDHQRRGIAGAICDALESGCGALEFITHASITARPFFESRGYTVVRSQQVQRRGVCLTNFVMRKENENRSEPG